MAHQKTDMRIMRLKWGLREPVKTERWRTEWGESTAGKVKEDITLGVDNEVCFVQLSTNGESDLVCLGKNESPAFEL